jgi:hypothetical protein
MADDTKSPPPPNPPQNRIGPPLANFQLSALCPGDLGVKAGFWSGVETEPVTFRPIVGWLTVTNYLDTGGNVGPLVPVVLSDVAYPTILVGGAIPHHIGVFKNESTAEEAREMYTRWQRKPEASGSPGQQGQPIN